MNAPLLSPERRLELEIAARSQAHVAPLALVAPRRVAHVVPFRTGVVVPAPHLTTAQRVGDTPVGTCEKKSAAVKARMATRPASDRALPLPTTKKRCAHCRLLFLPAHGAIVHCDACKARAEKPPAHVSQRELRALKAIRDGEKKRQYGAKVRARLLDGAV